MYDYLADGLAARLTRTLFAMAAAGGTLLIANFVPDISDRGYMETFMDWQLIYRTPPVLEALAGALPSEHVAQVRSFVEPNQNIAFVEIQRS